MKNSPLIVNFDVENDYGKRYEYGSSRRIGAASGAGWTVRSAGKSKNSVGTGEMQGQFRKRVSIQKPENLVETKAREKFYHRHRSDISRIKF